LRPNFAQNTCRLLHAIALERAFLRRKDRECSRRIPQARSIWSNPAQDAIGRPGQHGPAVLGAFGCPCWPV